MVAYLEKTDGNAEFHEIIDFLTRSSIHYALTVSPVVSTTFVEQFWMTAKSKTINNVRYITATVAGKPVSISEASIRSDLQFNDAAGIDVPSSSNPIPDSIPEGSGGNHGGQSSSDRSLSGNEDGLTLQKKIGKEEVFEDKVDAEGVCIQQGRKPAKSKPTVHKDPAFDDLDDAMDYMETEDAHDEGTGRTVKKQELILKTKARKFLRKKAESEGVNEAEKKFKMLVNDEEIAKKVQEEWETEEEKKKLAEEEAIKAALIRDYDDI
ncbi:hypothetical protein Tco_0381966 [Tanacetum coccineum]